MYIYIYIYVCVCVCVYMCIYKVDDTVNRRDISPTIYFAYDTIRLRQFAWLSNNS